MPYRNLGHDNEKYLVNDIKQRNDPILQSVIKQVKQDIGAVLMQFEEVTAETVTEIMEKYNPHILGVQTIHCQSRKYLQVDVIVGDMKKIREDLWRSCETDRFVRQLMRGR